MHLNSIAKTIQILLLSTFGFTTIAKGQLKPAESVDPFIGTDGFGHTFPGATTPFGMVQLSPDTRTTGWENCSGYHSSNKTIIGFSHMHLSGTGAADLGDIMFMATIGKQIRPGKEDSPLSGYRSSFKHDSEKANPGYYSVMLEDHKILAEMTATTRTGVQRYTFPTSDSAFVILDLNHGIEDKTTETFLYVVNKNTVAGYRRSKGWAKDQIIYFHTEFSEEFNSYGIYNTKSEPLNGNSQNIKEGLIGAFQFKTNKGRPILIKTGLSTVSIENAKLNLDAECKGWDFEKTKADAFDMWNRELSRIVIEGGTKSQQSIFYSALYHCMIHPNTMSDVDGRYRGMDGQVHTITNGQMYTVFSLWDTFRALHPLFTIIDPARAQEFVRSILLKFKETGTLPVWELASNETGCMIGYHSVPVIVDTYMKGLKDFDTTLALNACMKSAMMDHLGLNHYKKHGYIPADKENESVSKTLEYAYDDWCIYKMAESMGKKTEASIFEKRGKYFLNVFDSQSGFVRGKKNGNWVTPFDPYEVSGIYTEANAWQYNFFVPHDIPAMIELSGGITNFTNKLDSLFSASTKLTGRSQPDISGLIGQYAHGNEPSHHMAYLFNYSEKPYRTADITSRIMNEFYTTGRNGLIGNEDCGQMSAWYVFSALGIYPTCPGNNLYDMGTPLFKKATIQPGNGKTITITSNKTKSEDIYVESAYLNDQASQLQIDHKDLAKGANISFNMTSEKSKHLKLADNNKTDSINTVMIPYLESCEKSFFDSCLVAMHCPTKGAEIRFTRDGSEPTRKSELFTAPFYLKETTKLKMIGYKNGFTKSTIEEVDFIRLPYRKQVNYKNEYSHNYTGGGKNGLVDGIKGEPNAFGSWQGFWGKDFEVVIDLGEIRDFTKIESTYLQQYPSWIWLPASVTYFISDDGKNFKEVFSKKNNTSKDKEGSFVEPFIYKGSNKARFVKVVATNMGSCPEWHPGAGNPSWIFIDEISID